MFSDHRRRFTLCLLFIEGSLPVFTVHMRKFTDVYGSWEEVYRCLLITVGSLPVFTV